MFESLNDKDLTIGDWLVTSLISLGQTLFKVSTGLRDGDFGLEQLLEECVLQQKSGFDQEEKFMKT